MRKNGKIIVVFSLLVFCSGIFNGCITTGAEKKNSSQKKELSKDNKLSKLGKKKLAYLLYRTIVFEAFDKMREILNEDIDPNYCNGEYPWFEDNPLNVIANYYSCVSEIKESGGDYLNPPDEKMLHILVEGGADINRRPYIWFRVNEKGKKSIQNIEEIGIERGIKQNSKEMDYFIQDYVFDINRLLEAFILAGADPDMLGHPYPYDIYKHRGAMNDELAKKYFAKGTRPINEAIKKGMIWETQVDLLLKYVKLDENSLKAAQELKDPAMIKKIDKLWSEQLKEAVKAKERRIETNSPHNPRKTKPSG